ncbi:MAG TPA: carnitine dehydratase [Gammaproteobacteria bacterium]|nr:carnitine dehydratase [Gammaproteobacteria bacterium]
MLPLEGITIISLEQAVAAPFATRQLAELGARVIKVERPEVGDFARSYDERAKGLASHFAWLNRSKESLTLDLKQPEGQKILAALVEKADVFLQNLAPGATERLGFGSDALREKYPQLIVCNISGYGTDGPYQKKKAYDLLIQCEAGMLSITGTEETPSKVGISVADISGAMYAYSGILTALYQRTQTGQGTVLDVSLFDTLGEWMGFPAYFAYEGAEPPKRTGASHSAIAPYGPFTTGDNEQVNLGVQNEREWAKFCEIVIQRPDLIQDDRFNSNYKRVTNRDELTALINGALSTLSTAEVVKRLDEASIANARMNTMAGFWNHPQYAARDRWTQVESPVGPLKALKPPVIMRDSDYKITAIPGLGENNDNILQEIGYSESDIQKLKQEGVI